MNKLQQQVEQYHKELQQMGVVLSVRNVVPDTIGQRGKQYGIEQLQMFIFCYQLHKGILPVLGLIDIIHEKHGTLVAIHKDTLKACVIYPTHRYTTNQMNHNCDYLFGRFTGDIETTQGMMLMSFSFCFIVLISNTDGDNDHYHR